MTETSSMKVADAIAAFVASSGLPITTAAESLGPLRAMFYGAPGTGKTRLISSASKVPEMSPVLLLDVDPGTMSVSDHDNLHVMHVRNSTQLMKIGRLLASANCPFRTVALDDLQEFYLMLLQERLQTESGKAGKDANVPWQDDWMWTTFKFRAMIKSFKGLPQHMLASTLEQYTADARTEALMRTPLMTGKLTWEIEKYFDISGWLSVKGTARNQTRMLQVQPFQGTRAKDRTPAGRLGSRIENPTMQIIYDACYKGTAPKQVLDDDDETTPSEEAFNKLQDDVGGK